MQLQLVHQGKRAATAEGFKDALAAAAGAAPKDNPSQLRKALKRREKAKETSAKQWGDRKDKVMVTFELPTVLSCGAAAVAQTERRVPPALCATEVLQLVTTHRHESALASLPVVTHSGICHHEGVF